MKKFGLIGYPLEHSFSPSYFAEKFFRENLEDTQYKLFPIERIELLTDLIDFNTSLRGLNVTIPYKEEIIPYLDEIDSIAEKIGAVNTVQIHRNEKATKLKGFNTDWIGIEKSIFSKFSIEGDCLILGSGGASKAMKYVLEKRRISYTSVGRDLSKVDMTYHQLEPSTIRDHQLIVNCTPLGTFPDIDGYPRIPYEYLNDKHVLFDMVYNPELTAFMKFGQLRGAKVMNGYQMLCHQAEASWDIWNE